MCLAVPGKIESIYGVDPVSRVGRINFGGVIKEASLAYVSEAKVDDYVIVHAGFAISRLDAEEAERTYQLLAEMEQAGEEVPAVPENTGRTD